MPCFFVVMQNLVGFGCTVMNMSDCLSVCLSVCLPACISRKPYSRNAPNFYACCFWPWLGPPLTSLRYVMYFRFCGRRHIFIPWGPWARIKHGVIIRKKFSRWQQQLAPDRVRQNATPWA